MNSRNYLYLFALLSTGASLIGMAEPMGPRKSRNLFSGSQQASQLPTKKVAYIALAADTMRQYKELIAKAENVLKATIAKGQLSTSGTTTSPEDTKLIRDTLNEMNRFEETLQTPEVAQAFHAYAPTKDREPLDAKFFSLKSALVRTISLS